MDPEKRVRSQMSLKKFQVTGQKREIKSGGTSSSLSVECLPTCRSATPRKETEKDKWKIPEHT